MSIRVGEEYKYRDHQKSKNNVIVIGSSKIKVDNKDLYLINFIDAVDASVNTMLEDDFSYSYTYAHKTYTNKELSNLVLSRGIRWVNSDGDNS